MARPALESPHNPRFRSVLELRDATGRRGSGRFLIDGQREIGRALAAGVRVREAWFARASLERAGTGAESVFQALRAAGAELVEVTPALLARLAYGDRDEGLVAVGEVPSTSLDDLRPGADALVGVVEGVEKPGNLGAILRSADGAGVDAVIVTDPRTDPWNPNCIRASLGTVFSVPLAVADGAATRAWLGERGLRLVATRVDAPRPYTDADLRGGVAIVLGSEAEGLTEAWSDAEVEAVRIPMRGVADSLNVSVSAALLFYEARRQRG